MKFLLFFISLIFSTIFYIFANLSNWKNFLWNIINNPLNLEWFSQNLLIESFLFLLIWLIFLYLFSNLKSSWSVTIKAYKLEIYYFLYYICFIFYIYFFNKWFDFYLITLIITFVLSDMVFLHISNIYQLDKFKIKLKYIWLILNYLSSILAIFYIYKYSLHFIPAFILIFNLFFNVVIHKKYTNYISLFFSILILLFLLYSLYFFVFGLYIS